MSASQIQNVAAEEVYSLLHSRPEGLAAAEVAARLREVGPNTLDAPQKGRILQAILKHFTNFFSILLCVSSAVCFVAERMQPGESMALLGWALLGVAILNGAFAFAQEHRAERSMQELKKFLPPKALVRRGGVEQVTLAEALAPGDVLVLAEGDRIPADARLVESDGLLVDNSPLSGESRSQALSAAASPLRLVDSLNIAFAGCSVLRGSGVAVIFATGRRTEFGKIAALSHEIRRPPSPLERQTGRMVRVLTRIAVTMGLLFFAYGVFAGRPLWVNLVFMLGIIVANVPEGLLPTMTLALSMGSLRMARKKVLVKTLEAVEALGAVHVLCTDKTGTLTMNRLALTQLVDALAGREIHDPRRRQQCLKLALIASEVRVHDGEWAGDPLDVAVAQRHSQECGDPLEVARRTRRHFPFDVHTRREAGLYQDERGAVFAVKGAWESLRPLIQSIERESEEAAPAGEAELAQADAVARHLASQGKRVIALASRRLAAGAVNLTEERLEQSLTLSGFLVLEDPLRPEAAGAVRTCRQAGVRVVLITGDHPDTAEAVARELGILDKAALRERHVLRGEELERLRLRELQARLQDGVAVFARTTPEQKMKIVMALKQMGLVVGMTGDGVNDAPALKAADVGIAMGREGTDVAREAADIILLDDNFASIVAGVEEGRAISANIRKFTNYVLASNVPEIVPYLLYILLPVPLGLTIIQILSIDLGTDIVPAMGLGQERPEPETMCEPPRSRNEPLLSGRLLVHSYLFLGVIQAAFSSFLFFWTLSLGGWQYGQELPANDPLYRSATGVALSSIILMQIGNLVGRRSRRHSGLDAGLLENRLLLLGIALEAAFSWAILYAPPVQRVLGTGPAPVWLYVVACLGAPLLFGADLARKAILERSNPPAQVRLSVSPDGSEAPNA